MCQLPPRSPPFPYTTLFRSHFRGHAPGPCARPWPTARRARRRNCARRPPRNPARTCRPAFPGGARSEEHTSELQSHVNLVCRLLLEKKKKEYHTIVTSTIQL